MLQHPFFSAGFRPFFFGAALFAAGAVPAWVLAYAGLLDLGRGAGNTWHAHEMIFGYLFAVLTGFLTIRLSGRPLLILVGVWLAGRAAMLSQAAPPLAVAAIDLSFVPALIALRRPALWSIWKWPNGLFLPLLLGFWGVNFGYHFSMAAWVQVPPAVPVDLAAILLVAIGGRLVPGYTGATLVHIRPPRGARLEGASVLLLAVATVMHVARYPQFAGPCLVAVALLQGWRMIAWRPWETRGHPLLWILHLGYAWLVAGLALHGLTDFAPGAIPASAALHAITAGAIGSLTLGMMTRITLIHTRRDVAADHWATAAFVLMQVAAALRVFGPIVTGETLGWAGLAAIAWALAFALWLARHARTLLA